ncbi:MAG: glycosyltransferase family 4 protein [Microcoleaceae cyanobacterium]
MTLNSLLITDTFSPRVGGREAYYNHLFSYLKQNKTVVITPDKTGDYQAFDRQSHFSIYRVSHLSEKWYRWGRPGRFLWLKTLIPICKIHQIDLVHCGVVLPDGLSGWLLQKTLGIPYIIYTHGKEILENQKNPENEQLMRMALNSAIRVVTNSHYTAGLLRDFGVSADKIVRIAPGIVPQQWTADIPSQQVEKLRQQHQIGNRPVILTVGRLKERKGHDTVMQAMPAILSEIPDAVYLIVGNGPEKENLQALTQKMGLEKAVIFAGEVADKDLPAYYQLATVFTMISRQPPGSHEVEGFGIVYLEANACGLPVVAGRSGGVPDAVVDGETGFLVNPFKSEEAATAIIKLLQNTQLCQQLANTGQKRALEEFSWEHSSQQLQQLITAVEAETTKRSLINQAVNTVPLILKHRILNEVS